MSKYDSDPVLADIKQRLDNYLIQTGQALEHIRSFSADSSDPDFTRYCETALTALAALHELVRARIRQNEVYFERMASVENLLRQGDTGKAEE